MMNATMAAMLNEIMSIQADEVCGAGYGERTDARVNSRNGCRRRDLRELPGERARPQGGLHTPLDPTQP